MEDEAAAVAALRAGDLGGLDTILCLYQGRAIKIAYTITGELESARDAVQAAFLRLARSIQTYDPSRPFAPWFFKIVTRKAIDIAEERSKFVMGPDVDDVLAMAGADEVAGPEEAAEKAELARLMAGLLAELRPMDRAVIALRYYSDLTEHGVAEIVGASEKAVHQRLRRARNRLRDLMRSRAEFEVYLDEEPDE